MSRGKVCLSEGGRGLQGSPFGHLGPLPLKGTIHTLESQPGFPSQLGNVRSVFRLLGSYGFLQGMTLFGLIHYQIPCHQYSTASECGRPLVAMPFHM